MVTKHIQDGFPEQRQIILDKVKLQECNKAAFTHTALITRIGHYPLTNFHLVERPDGLDEHVLILNISGQGRLRIDDRLWEIHPNTVTLIPRGKPHAYGADDSVPWNIYWLHIRGAQADAFLNWKQTLAAEPILNLSDVTRLIEYFETVIRYSIAEFDESTLAKRTSLTYQILTEIIAVRSENNLKGKKVEERIIRSIRYMQASLDTELTLEDLSQVASLSVPHYCALFKNHTGTTPLRFFTRLRLQKACDFLENTNLSVGDISEKIGFEDPFYFGRVFKKFMRVTPSGYRKKLNG